MTDNGIISSLFQQASSPLPQDATSPLALVPLLAQLGALGSATGTPSSSRIPSGTAPLPTGGLQSWIDQAERAAGVGGGPNVDRMLNILVSHESGGDPNIVNSTPTPRGYHAEGLAQMIPPTFQSYAIPGLGGIDNPVANLAAAIRYMIDRYGSIRNTPGIASVLAGHGYQPY